MNRRHFVRLLGAAVAAPAMPAPVAMPAARPASAAAGAAYSRTLYGHAVFHARTRASLSAADLMTRLKVSAAQAEALMGEMSARGVLTPVVQGAVTVMRAANATSKPAFDLGKLAGKAADLLVDDDEDVGTQGNGESLPEAATPGAAMKSDAGSDDDESEL